MWPNGWMCAGWMCAGWMCAGWMCAGWMCTIWMCIMAGCYMALLSDYCNDSFTILNSLPTDPSFPLMEI